MINGITLLIEPSLDPTLPFSAGTERYQRLSDELGYYAGTQVKVATGDLSTVPRDNFVLLASSGDVARSLGTSGPKLPAKLAQRILLLDINWETSLEQVEKYNLAGAVDSLRLSEWLARPSSCTGPFGLRYLTKPMGASCIPLPMFHSSRYCLFQSKVHRGLPHLLSDYLKLYERDLEPLSGSTHVNLARIWKAKTDDVTSGIKTGNALVSQVEYASALRAIQVLKKAREASGLSLTDLAKTSGADVTKFSLLESGDFSGTTLGTLHAYAQAIEPKCGWAIFENRASARLWPQSFKEIGEQFAGLLSNPEVTTAPEHSEIPWILDDRGMTFVGNHRFVHLGPPAELKDSNLRTLRDESYAAV